MDDIEYELQVTMAVARTFMFYLAPEPSNYRFVRCNICGERLMKNYAGKPINERMIEHAQGKHSEYFHQWFRFMR